MLARCPTEAESKMHRLSLIDALVRAAFVELIVSKSAASLGLSSAVMKTIIEVAYRSLSIVQKQEASTDDLCSSSGFEIGLWTAAAPVNLMSDLFLEV
jgi:hypothetical protein